MTEACPPIDGSILVDVSRNFGKLRDYPNTMAEAIGDEQQNKSV